MLKKIFKKLSSVRMAVTLILFITVLSLLGIIIPQAPAAIAATKQGYVWWVDNIAYAKLGTMVYTLEPLGLFKIFRSAWFIGASALLVLNILVCTVSRIGSLRLKTEKAHVQTEPTFFQSENFIYQFETPSPIRQVGDAAFRLLEDRNYSPDRKDSQEDIFLAGDKRRFSPWGTLLVHLSLILLIIGVLAGIWFGFRDDMFVVSEGTAREVGHDTGIAVYLDSFTDDYWDNGSPKDYRSDVVIYDDGQPVLSSTIRVNHPLTYRGVRFHQGFFGQAVRLSITDDSGAAVYTDTVPLTDVSQDDSLQRPQGEAVLPDNQYHIVIIGHAAAGTDPSIGENQVGIEFYDADMNFLGWLLLDQGSSQKLGDLSFSFENLQYAGLMISRDPGANFVWAAAALFLIGLGMVFYFPRRRVWIRLEPASDSSTKVSVRFDTSRELGVGDEAPSFLKALETAVTSEGS